MHILIIINENIFVSFMVILTDKNLTPSSWYDLVDQQNKPQNFSTKLVIYVKI